MSRRSGNRNQPPRSSSIGVALEQLLGEDDLLVMREFLRDSDGFGERFISRVLSDAEFAAMIARDEDLAPILTRFAYLVSATQVIGG